jgi:hypothetical protein
MRATPCSALFQIHVVCAIAPAALRELRLPVIAADVLFWRASAEAETTAVGAKREGRSLAESGKAAFGSEQFKAPFSASPAGAGQFDEAEAAFKLRLALATRSDAERFYFKSL